MKKTALILTTAMAASFVSAESAVESFNEKGYGTISGRLQSLSMYRDYDNGNNAHSTTLGIMINYLSPEKEGWTIGLGYNGASVLDSMDYDNPPAGLGPGERLVGNGRINVLNEAYLNYNMEAFGLTNTSVTAGRRINNGEIFRADDIRQKSRAISAVQAESKDIKNFRVAGGHAFEMSHVFDTGDLWKFNDFGDVLGAGYDTDGLSWAEGSYTGVDNLEIALFDAYAWDVVNMIGTRIEYDITPNTAVLGYFRNETDQGKAADHSSNALGLSVVQKIGKVKLEGGFLGINGDGLTIDQRTVGFNHALGASLMIYSGQYIGGAETLYLKATTKLENSNTTLYALYNYTMNDKTNVDAQELNLIVKQPFSENFTATVKGGIGYNDATENLATDIRLFLTYAF